MTFPPTVTKSVTEPDAPSVTSADEMNVAVVEGDGFTRAHSWESRLVELVLSADPVYVALPP